MKQLFILLCALVVAMPRLCAAGQGDSVVVVYNRKLPESKKIAEHYAARREVPARQVIGLNLPETETMSRAAFREQLQQPLLKALKDQKLFVFDSDKTLPSAAKVRYAVLCYGVPLKIESDGGIVEQEASKLPQPLRRNEASVDSELACLPMAERGYRLTGSLTNPSFNATNTALLHPTNGVLMVARLDGPSAEIARGLVDKAIEAEKNGLWGRAYFDARGLSDGDYLKGDNTIKEAYEYSRYAGFESVLDEKPATFSASFPLSQVMFYAGWYDAHASGPFTLPSVEFMPGAIAYHIHSFSAETLRSNTRHWAGPLLAKGAAATMGSVYEPYLEGTPNVGSFLSRLVLLGFTFGEAAYACQGDLSWQTTVVGDPLYRPFSRHPRDQHLEMAQAASPFIEWSHLRVINVNLNNKVPIPEGINYLESLPVTRTSPVLLEKMGDLHLLQNKPDEAVRAYVSALKAGPTPQQNVRLTLQLARVLTESGRDKEAFDVYRLFATQSPEYPDRQSILRSMTALADKAGDHQEAASMREAIKTLSAK